MTKGKRKSRRKKSNGVIKGISNTAGRGVNMIARTSGRVVGNVPIIGKPMGKIFNDVGKLGKDTTGLVGTATSTAAGVFTNPFMKLFGTKKTSGTRRRSVMRRGSKRRGSKRRGSKRRGSKRRGSKRRGSKRRGSKRRGSKRRGSKRRGSKRRGSKRRGSKRRGSKRRGSRRGGSKRRGSKRGGSNCGC
jgi:hypothetical protein